MYGEKKAQDPTKDWDVLFSIILFIASGALILYSVQISLQAMRITDAVFYTAPGFATFVIGIALSVLSVALGLSALRKGGSLKWMTWDYLKTVYTSRKFKETFLVFLYLCLYMWVFWDTVPFTRIRVPFWLSTFLFLFGMMKTFKAATTKTILLVSAVTTALVQLFFGYFVGIPLP